MKLIEEGALHRRSYSAIVDAGYEKRRRVKAALAGQPVDRPPVAFWNHSQPGKSAAALANAALDFCVERFDLDIIKIMGDIRYPIPVGAIQEPAQWRSLEHWGGCNEFTRSYLSAVRQVRAAVGPAYPIVITVYSSIQWAFLFVGGAANFVRHYNEAPGLVHEGMANIALNMRDLASGCIEAGADGIFFSAIGCDESIPRQVYSEVCRPYDFLVLNSANAGWLNLLHAHSDLPSIRLEDMLDYPVHGLSWATTTTGRTFASVREKTAMCLMGGWDHNMSALTEGSGDDLVTLERWAQQARLAAQESAGGGFILAPGCSIPNHSTDRAMTALRQSVTLL